MNAFLAIAQIGFDASVLYCIYALVRESEKDTAAISRLLQVAQNIQSILAVHEGRIDKTQGALRHVANAQLVTAELASRMVSTSGGEKLTKC